MSFGNLIRYLQATLWAVEPDTLMAARAVLSRRLAGERLSRAEIDAVTGGPRAAPIAIARVDGGKGKAVAVLPLTGLIGHRADEVDDVSTPPGTSIQRFTARLREALADETVASILIDVDSPGGTVNGVEELAAEILAARSTKPIVAIANTWAASAAYFIASAAEELVVMPSGEVGSIGVFNIHQDFSGMEEQLGIKTTITAAGKFKTEGNPFEPLGADAQAAVQVRIDVAMNAFVKAVAAGRGVKASEVRSGFGQGRIIDARAAVEMGMADRVATFDQTLARLLGRRTTSTARRPAARRPSASVLAALA